MGVFSEYASQYHKLGLPVIPVVGKSPIINDWTKLNIDNYSEEYLNYLIKTYPNAGIGLVLGESTGISGLDLDVYDQTDEIKLFFKNIGATDIGKYGLKGGTLFYRDIGRKKIILKGFIPEKYKGIKDKSGKPCEEKYRNKLEILSQGQHTVLPPSVHPDLSGGIYKWYNKDKTLLSYDCLESLPELTDELIALITKYFHEIFGTNEKQTRKQYAGRNDHLKTVCHAMFHKNKTPYDVAKELVTVDVAYYPDNPLFSDEKEWTSNLKTPEERSLSFAFSNYKSFVDVKIKEPSTSDKKENKNYEQIGFYHRYTILSENGKIKTVDKPKYELMADHCFENKNLCFDDAQSLKYDGKKWNWFTKTALINFIMDLNKTVINPSHIDLFAKSIKGKCFSGSMGLISSDGFINVNNGLVDVQTGELIPHTYKYLFRYSSPVNYDKDAKCPLWYRFLNEVFCGDTDLVHLAQRILGYTILGGRPFLQISVCLFGGGRNGKSTLLDVFRAVIGDGSYSSVSMSKIDKEFSVIALDGKLANIVEETPTDEINSEAFKNLTAGGKTRGAHKGFDEYEFECTARFIFACNDMPRFKDTNVSMLDRLVFLPFNRYFEEHERDVYLKEKLLLELPGILNWAIEGARIVKETKSLNVPKSSTDLKNIYREESNSVYAWFNECVSIDKSQHKYHDISSLYAAYKNWCEETGTHTFGKKSFSTKFKTEINARLQSQLLPKIDDNRYKNDKNGQSRGYKNITFII